MHLVTISYHNKSKFKDRLIKIKVCLHFAQNKVYNTLKWTQYKC